MNATAHGLLSATLHEYGLDSLGTWAWNRFKETGSVDLVMLEMQQQPVYRQRFAARLALQDKGFSMTEAEQIGYETQMRQYMQAAGMPPDFYDSPSDFEHLIAAGISPTEVSQRVNDAYLRVAQAPQSVRDAMAEYYGPGSDGALAAFALDSERAAPAVMRAIGASEAGGYLAQQNITIDRTVAERLATAQGNQTAAIQAAAQQMGKLEAAGTFSARPGEEVANEETGLAATFEGDAAASREILREAQTRQAEVAGHERFGSDTSGLGTGQRH
jgi:hypothetical protein